MEFTNYLKEKLDIINCSLDKYLKFGKDVPEILVESMRYSIFAGGKRLRPILVLATTETFGGDINKALPAACAIEMIHTYSLIHDDLPCMDDDDYRRGKPTNHKKFSENIAVLAGDSLLTHSFYLISKNYPPEIGIKLIEFLSLYSGEKGMLGGQVLDVINEKKKIDLETLNQIHLKKTAALIKCSILMGAVCSNVKPSQIELLDKFSDMIGLGFQIVDDILDVTSTTEELGKPVGSDFDNEKATYPVLLGLEKAKEKADFLLKGSLEILDEFEVNTELLKGAAEKLILRTK